MAEIGDIKYLNTGSALHPNGVTCIELSDERLRLIRWTQCVDERRHICVRTGTQRNELIKSKRRMIIASF